jgi:hypothetical protein
MVSVPPELTFRSTDYRVPMDEEYRDMMMSIFRAVRGQHVDETITYTFSPEALQIFWDYHDGFYLTEKTKFKDDDNRRGVLSKSLGYSIRLACVIHILGSVTENLEGERNYQQYLPTMSPNCNLP